MGNNQPISMHGIWQQQQQFTNLPGQPILVKYRSSKSGRISSNNSLSIYGQLYQIDAAYASQQKQIYQMRMIPNSNLVCVYDINGIDGHCGCNSIQKVHIITERLFCRLQDIQSITPSEADYILLQVLFGFQMLNKYSNILLQNIYPRVTVKKIGFTQDMNVKVWVSQNYGTNGTFEDFCNSQDESIIILIRAIQSKIQNKQFNSTIQNIIVSRTNNLLERPKLNNKLTYKGIIKLLKQNQQKKQKQTIKNLMNLKIKNIVREQYPITSILQIPIQNYQSNKIIDKKIETLRSTTYGSKYFQRKQSKCQNYSNSKELQATHKKLEFGNLTVQSKIMYPSEQEKNKNESNKTIKKSNKRSLSKSKSLNSNFLSFKKKLNTQRPIQNNYSSTNNYQTQNILQQNSRKNQFICFKQYFENQNIQNQKKYQNLSYNVTTKKLYPIKIPINKQENNPNCINISKLKQRRSVNELKIIFKMKDKVPTERNSNQLVKFNFVNRLQSLGLSDTPENRTERKSSVTVQQSIIQPLFLENKLEELCNRKKQINNEFLGNNQHKSILDRVVTIRSTISVKDQQDNQYTTLQI